MNLFGIEISQETLSNILVWAGSAIPTIASIITVTITTIKEKS